MHFSLIGLLKCFNCKFFPNLSYRKSFTSRRKTAKPILNDIIVSKNGYSVVSSAILLIVGVFEMFSRSRTCLLLIEPSAGCQSYASLTNTANPNVSWTNLPAMLSKFASAVIGSCLVSLLSLTNYTWISFHIFNYFFRRRRYEYWWIILDTNNCFSIIPQVLSNSVLNIRFDVETILF